MTQNHERQRGRITSAAATLALVGAVVLLAGAAFYFQPHVQNNALANLLTLFGGLALGVAVYLSPPTLPAFTPTHHPLQPERLSWRSTLVLVAGALLLALVTGVTIVAVQNNNRALLLSHHLQFALLLLGVVLIVLGAGAVGWGSARIRFGRRPRHAAMWTLALLGLVTLLALALRLWGLNDVIPYSVDENNFIVGVGAFWLDDRIDLIAPRVMSFTGIYSYWQVLSIDFLGRNFTGLRFPSAVIGALTVPALYLLVRTLFDRPTGLVAALLLATFPPHVQFSRLGLNNIVDPLFGVLALAFLARGLRFNRRLDYALAGVFLGATQYFYEGGRVIFPLLTLGWLLLLALAGKLPDIRRAGRGLLVLALTFVLVAAPHYVTLSTYGAPLLSRLGDRGLDPEFMRDLLLANVDDGTFQQFVTYTSRNLGLYFNSRDASVYFGGHLPLVLAYLLTPLLIGVWLTIWRPGRWGLWLGTLTIALTVAGTQFVSPAGQSPRHVVAFPAVCLLAAVGITETTRLLFQRRNGSKGLASRRTLTLLAVTTVIAVGHITYYFGPHVQVMNWQLHLYSPFTSAQDAMLRSRDFPPGTQVYIVSDPPLDRAFLNEIIGFFGDGRAVETLAPADITQVWLLGLDSSADHAFFIRSGDDATRDLLASTINLRDPQLSDDPTIPSELMFHLYYKPSRRGGALTP